jgi:TolC family type I secretion outer membrane protein
VDHLTAGAPSLTQAPSLAANAGAAHRQATTMAIADSFGWIGMVMLAGIVVALMLHETKLFRPPVTVAAGVAPQREARRWRLSFMQAFQNAPVLKADRLAAFFRRGIFLVVLAATVPNTARAADRPFEAALSQAYLYNPQLLAARRQLREADEGVPKALSGWRPRVAIEGSIGVSAVFDSMDPTHQPERRVPQESLLTITQPLYTGGRVHAQVSQAEALVDAERAGLQATEAAVLLAAATAYLDVARDQRVVDLNHNEETVLERTLHASEQELAAGAVTETDVAQARARLADQRARTAQALAALGASRASYEQQIGQPPGPSPLPGPPLDVPPALAEALTHVPDNFDVLQSRAAQAAAAQGIDIARAGLRPRLSAEFHGGRSKETDVQFPHQRDDLAEATLQLTIPIYQGGEQAAEIRQAKEAAARSLLQVDVVLRRARAQILAAWADLDGARARIAEYNTSLAANTIAARGVARQQSVGARTLLEVLNAQQEQLAAQVNLITAQRDDIVAGLELLAVTGQLSAAKLKLDVALYDPIQHYTATRGRWYGTTPSP